MDKEHTSTTEEASLPEALPQELPKAPKAPEAAETAPPSDDSADTTGPSGDGDKETEEPKKAGGCRDAAAVGCGFAFMLLPVLFLLVMALLGDAAGGAILLGAMALFIVSPVALTLSSIVWLFLPTWRFSEKWRSRLERTGLWLEWITVIWGWICTVIWTEFHFAGTRWVDWQEQLYNNEVAAPIAMETIPTLVTLMLAALAGHLILRLVKPEKLPPLLSVLSIASLYIGGGVCGVWICQVIYGDPVMCLLPFNLILIYAKVIRDAVIGWREHHPEAAEHRSPVVRFFARMMNNSSNWPLLALVLAIPLLGVIIALLTLLGQAPDSIIQAWTQTSDWNFSQQVGPQNLHYDEHYLCTVAAGGHRKVVKPIRKGKRHGHMVTVNRQLCVANAFEQLLEERLPRVHVVVRGIYDKYGYPIARHIRTPLAADVVWVLMKPLEWLFLAVLYLCDSKPENRIAVQYPHAPLPKFGDKNRED